MILKFNEVSRAFRGPDGVVDAVMDLSFGVAAGDMVAVQGPSGCGKTTLLLMAGALLRPTSGEVLVDGRDPYELPPDDRSGLRAEKIGFVFQQFYLIPYLSVLDNILAATVPRPDSKARKRAEELVDRFGLGDRRRHVPAQLSTGEQQRVALARAVVNGPRLVLADEPTGNLDAENVEIVLAHLKEFASSGGGVLLVTHDAAVADHADRTLQMKAGRIPV